VEWQVEAIEKQVYQLKFSKSNYERLESIRSTISALEELKEMIEREEDCKKKEEVPKIREGIVEKLLAEIDFVYKPTLKDDIYESDYLEQFSQLRRADLVLCGALEAFNDFWTANSVEFGNVFASVPAKLVGEEKTENLIALGWQRTHVRLYLASDMQLSEIYRSCERAFPNYLIVKENKGSRFIILEYLIPSNEQKR
jgi:hypothetical protein